MRKMGRTKSGGLRFCADRAGRRDLGPGSKVFSCGRWDLNPHGIATTRSLVLLVCQFRHFRKKKIFRPFFMQEKGLEPSLYCYNRHLKPARLPIPPFLRANSILLDFGTIVNTIFEFFSYFFLVQKNPRKYGIFAATSNNTALQKSTLPRECASRGAFLLYGKGFHTFV